MAIYNLITKIAHSLCLGKDASAVRHGGCVDVRANMCHSGYYIFPWFVKSGVNIGYLVQFTERKQNIVLSFVDQVAKYKHNYYKFLDAPNYLLILFTRSKVNNNYETYDWEIHEQNSDDMPFKLVAVPLLSVLDEINSKHQLNCEAN